ncbi:MAG TPA: hypothetical protein HPP77_04505 [Candidatus Hydrogenedentes bacterium]|nr:hypothetical protein [Candidatus Hydrogenedentota bacterium]
MQAKLKGKKRFLVNSAVLIADNTVEPIYQEYDFELTLARDREKRMHESITPVVIEGQGIMEGADPVHRKQVYDGTMVRRRETDKHYVISRQPERYGGPVNAWETVERVVRQLYELKDNPNCSWDYHLEGEQAVLSVDIPGEAAKSVVLRSDPSKGHRIEKCEILHPDGYVLSEVAFSDFKEFPGDVWYATKAVQREYLGEDVLYHEYAHEAVELRVNERSVPESLLQLEIPPDAFVFFPDVGINMSGEELSALPRELIDTPELAAFAAAERKASTQASSSRSGSPTGPNATGTPNQNSGNRLPVVLILSCLALIAACTLAAMCYRRGWFRRP